MGKMLAAVLLGIAEMVQDTRRERQAAGIDVAKKQGKYQGLPAAVSTSETMLKADGTAVADPGAIDQASPDDTSKPSARTPRKKREKATWPFFSGVVFCYPQRSFAGWASDSYHRHTPLSWSARLTLAGSNRASAGQAHRVATPSVQRGPSLSHRLGQRKNLVAFSDDSSGLHRVQVPGSRFGADFACLFRSRARQSTQRMLNSS